MVAELKQYLADASEAAAWRVRPRSVAAVLAGRSGRALAFRVFHAAGLPPLQAGPELVALRDVEKASNANNEGTTRSWVKPLDFIQSCDDFVGPLPADHPSLLAPVFAGRQEAKPMDALLILQTWDAAGNLRAQSMQPGFTAAPATPCTRADLVHPQPPPSAKPKIGERCSASLTGAAGRRGRVAACACSRRLSPRHAPSPRSHPDDVRL